MEAVDAAVNFLMVTVRDGKIKKEPKREWNFRRTGGLPFVYGVVKRWSRRVSLLSKTVEREIIDFILCNES